MPRCAEDKRREILDFIEHFQAENGYSPTVREICEAVGLSSTSTVHNHLKILEERGLIVRAGHKSRVMLSRREETLVTPAEDAGGELPEDDFLLNHGVKSLPLVGTVTAGVPILAEENIEDAIPFPIEFLRDGGDDSFILKVRGDSMIDAGILSGDYIIVRSQSTARNGDIVVAMLDGEATVKRFYRESDHIRLQPENQFYEPILSRDVEILGLVVALFRRVR